LTNHKEALVCVRTKWNG